MFEHFKRLFKHSTIYAVGNAINRAAAFLLLPLYTRCLGTSEYGTLELFYVISYVLQTFLGVMIAHAALRFYFEYNDDKERKSVISTALMASFLFTLPIVLILCRYSGAFSDILFKTNAYKKFFMLTFFIALFELSKEISLAFLRAKEWSIQFISISIAQLLVQISLNIYAVAYLKMGIYGILLGNLSSVFMAWIFLSFFTIKQCGLDFQFNKLKAMLKYSYPFVFATVGAMLIYSSDRFFLKTYSTLSVIGLYALGFRFGMVVKTLLIEPFTTGFGPFRFSVMNDNNAKEMYSRILVYFLYIVMFFSLFISIFTKEVLMIMSVPAFREAYKVVPLILLTVITGGVSYIFQTGIFLMKKTKYVFYITSLAALLILILNQILIPRFNMYGAAIASFIDAIFICVVTYYVSQRLYKIKYDFNRVVKILSIALLIYSCSLFVQSSDIVSSIFYKLVLIASFPFVLGILKFYTKEEVDKILFVKDFINSRIELAFNNRKV